MIWKDWLVIGENINTKEGMKLIFNQKEEYYVFEVGKNGVMKSP